MEGALDRTSTPNSPPLSCSTDLAPCYTYFNLKSSANGGGGAADGGGEGVALTTSSSSFPDLLIEAQPRAD